MRRPPGLRQHTTGVWFCHWDGRNHYFTKDRSQSEALYAESLRGWAEWRARRPHSDHGGRSVSVEGLALKFLEYKEATGGKRRRGYYWNHLQRFVAVFGNVRADLVRARDLQALKVDMVRGGYHPKTVSHDLGCVKSLFRWGVGMEMIGPVSLDFVRADPLPPPQPRVLEPEDVALMVGKVPPELAGWLAVSYLTMARPSEMVLIAGGRGRWETECVFACVSKSSSRSGELRRIVFSEEALGWLWQVEPRWQTESGYYQAVSAVLGPGGPHPLRHSGATHLRRAGVAAPDIDLLLGHLPSRVTRSYVQIAWPSLQSSVSPLTLL
jgi:integrase